MNENHPKAVSVVVKRTVRTVSCQFLIFFMNMHHGFNILNLARFHSYNATFRSPVLFLSSGKGEVNLRSPLERALVPRLRTGVSISKFHIVVLCLKTPQSVALHSVIYRRWQDIKTICWSCLMVILSQLAGWFAYSCCSRLEHRASLKRFVSHQFLNLRHR
jgi:hypothetical protein